MLRVGFEPTPPKRLELESSALDRSAIEADMENPGFDPGASSLLTTHRLS